MKIVFDPQNQIVILDDIKYSEWEDIPKEVKNKIPSEYYMTILSFLIPTPNKTICVMY
jgi:hypothetical protein